MANTYLSASIIAQEALMILENNCVMGNLVYRGHELEFTDTYNGYTPGQTINVRRPADFTVRSGKTASVQDITEGSTPITVNSQKGVDLRLSSTDLTLNIRDLSERVIRPAMIQLANQIDGDLLNLFSGIYNWVGTPLSTAMTSFTQYIKAPERLDLSGVPVDQRYGVLGPSDQWGIVGGLPAAFMPTIGQESFRTGGLPTVAGIENFSSQNVKTYVRGSAQASGTLAGGGATTTYAATLNSNTMSIGLGGYAQTSTFTVGDVFTLQGVFAVNPVTKATLSYLQQFVIVGGAASGTSITQTTTFTITPPIITSGAFQTVSAAPAASATAVFMGSSGSSYISNLVFHRNAMALIMVPMVAPPGAVDVVRKSYKGYSVRVIPYYTGADDDSNYRLDVLYGVKLLDPRAATRING